MQSSMSKFDILWKMFVTENKTISDIMLPVITMHLTVKIEIIQ